MRVDVTTDDEGVRRPNLPDDASYRVTADHGDEMDVELLGGGFKRLAALEERIGSPDDAEAFRQAVEGANSVAELKRALLGEDGPGAAPGRRP